MRASVYIDPADRITGLLEANNRYLGRAREAEAKAAVLALALDRIVDSANLYASEDAIQEIAELAADALAGIEVLPFPKLIDLVTLAEVLCAHAGDLDPRKPSAVLIAAALARITPDAESLLTPEEAIDLEEALRSWQAGRALSEAA